MKPEAVEADLARRTLTLLERVRLGLRWYGLAFCVALVVVAVVAWAANILATWSDGDVTAKVGLTLVTLAVIAVAVWFFRIVNASRRQLLAQAEINEGVDADPDQR